jgi:hypothetical protein
MRRPVLVLALCLAAFSASAKSLYWRDLDVVAHLDGDGRMHVVETQQIVFDGDWNGGERHFRVSPFQSLAFEGLTRVGADGRETAVVQGPLEQLDHFQMLDDYHLRWRSRLPSDPPFDHTAITYRIRYTLAGVIERINGRDAMNHDFAFPERDGVIEHFHLNFTADPVWRGIESPLTLAATNLAPGRSVIVRRTLRFTGAKPPAAIAHGVPQSVAVAFGVLFLICVALLALAFYSREAARGRFAYTPAEAIDDRWLEEHVFSVAPEVAAAALEGKVTATAVAAALAGLAQEKKIETRVEKHALHRAKLHMHLLVPASEVGVHRAALVKKLFFGRKEVDTDALRKHYQGTGFDPAATMKQEVEEQLSRAVRSWDAKMTIVNWWIDGALLFAALLLFPLLSHGGNDGALASSGIFFGVVSLVPALIAAFINSKGITAQPARFALVGAFLLPLLAVTTHYLFAAPQFFFHVPALLGAMLWALTVVHLVLDALRIRDSDPKLAFRVRLASARRYFLTQLRAREPRLRDDWFPYLIAFGLGSNVDSWFSANAKYVGGSSSGDFATSASQSTSSSSSSSSGWGWTGGGGAFGGAGASASWAMAAGAVSSGVAAPSSSSGGGGGGGGSSSGGGGGGGW